MKHVNELLHYQDPLTEFSGSMHVNIVLDKNKKVSKATTRDDKETQIDTTQLKQSNICPFAK